MPPSATRSRNCSPISTPRKLTPDVVVYNASYRTRGPFLELDPVEVAKAIEITAFGGFLVAQAAARRMLPRGHGAILFTGASASVKGYAQSAPFAMGKFALRGLAQSMARELSPQGIHVAHFVIDGGIKSARRAEPIRTSPTRCSIPTPSPRATCTCCNSRAAPGRTSSNCGRGWKNSERSPAMQRARAHCGACARRATRLFATRPNPPTEVQEAAMTTALPLSTDVIVVGGGNAAFCAALAAAEQGVSVLVLERAPEDEAGGNSRFTAGAFRCVYDGVEDLRKLMPDLSDEEVSKSDFGTYTEEKFFDDMGRITEYRTDPDLCEVLIKNSKATMLWMRDKGVRFMPIWGRQAYKIGGMFKFWGGLTVEAVGGGPGLVDALTKIARKNNITIAYGARAFELLADDDGVHGVKVKQGGKTHQVKAKCVVLASGGFQADAEMRTRYLGPGWELAKIRGTRFNTGDGIKMALAIGAQPIGNWSGGHAVPGTATRRRPAT